MPIKIAERLKPFTHLPGMEFPLPFTQQGVQIFPTALKILPDGELISLPLQGPISGFTAILDLQRGAIQVFGKSPEGYFRYWLFGREDELFCFQDKGKPLFASGPFKLSSLPVPPPPLEELSFGSTKKLDWELVKRRNLMAEILPIWFRLGQMVHAEERQGPSQYTSLAQGDYAQFMPLFTTGFRGLFWPQNQDINHLGYSQRPLPPGTDPFVLLAGGYRAIRSLLLHETKESLTILPHATKLFPQGRAINLHSSIATVDLDWTKARLRRVILHSHQTGSFSLQFPKEIKRFRINKISHSAQGPFDLQEGNEYLLDHFER